MPPKRSQRRKSTKKASVAAASSTGPSKQSAPKGKKLSDYQRDLRLPIPNGTKLWVNHHSSGWLPAKILEHAIRDDLEPEIFKLVEAQEKERERIRREKEKAKKKSKSKSGKSGKLSKKSKAKASKGSKGSKGKSGKSGKTEDESQGQEEMDTADDDESKSTEDEPVLETPSDFELSQHYFRYYVHYTQWDRRMDQWVTRLEIRLDEPQAAKKKRIAEAKQRADEALKKIGVDENHGYTEEQVHAHEEATKLKNLNSIVIGKFEMDTWYWSPFPELYKNCKRLIFCEYCLEYFGFEDELEAHALRCKLRHPPGMEIYRSKEEAIEMAMFELDGEKETLYCQNLCLISKLFLDHKTVELDCTPFLFYVLCEVDEQGNSHIVGYFSKEKESQSRYNLACILTLPCHQRKGYGKLLISISYELSKIEKKPGSPEKPISDLGKVSYMSYWGATLLDTLSEYKDGEELTLENLERKTCILVEDIQESLKFMKVLLWHQGRWVFNMRQVKFLREEKQRKKLLRAQKGKNFRVSECIPERLHWVPYYLTTNKVPSFPNIVRSNR